MSPFFLGQKNGTYNMLLHKQEYESQENGRGWGGGYMCSDAWREILASLMRCMDVASPVGRRGENKEETQC